jgi:hypothetical protein
MRITGMNASTKFWMTYALTLRFALWLKWVAMLYGTRNSYRDQAKLSTALSFIVLGGVALDVSRCGIIRDNLQAAERALLLCHVQVQLSYAVGLHNTSFARLLLELWDGEGDLVDLEKIVTRFVRIYMAIFGSTLVVFAPLCYFAGRGSVSLPAVVAYPLDPRSENAV